MLSLIVNTLDAWRLCALLLLCMLGQLVKHLLHSTPCLLTVAVLALCCAAALKLHTFELQPQSVLVHQLSRHSSQNPFRKNRGRVQRVAFHPLKPFFFVATQNAVRIYNLAKQVSAQLAAQLLL
jgi:hypothetical protein